jgi:hypothetical protein
MPEQNQNTLVDPGFMVEQADGSVIADPAKVAEAASAKEAEKSTSERPEWLPEKFKSAEDLAAAYKALESKLGQKPETKTAEQTLTPEQVTEKGFDMQALQSEYSEKGALSPETLAKLEAQGITKAAVNQYIEGANAKAAQVRSEFAQLAGGEDTLTSVLEWAQQNLSADEAAGYNALLEGGNHAAAKMAFQGIVSRYVAENGEAPTLVEAARVPSASGVKPYESMEQMTKDMAKPEYARDPAFRKRVEARAAVSTAF